jgi:cell fate regulator YaaT (PSP1 superfamily)
MIVGVNISGRDIEYYSCGKMNLKRNLTVIVETDKGLEFGTVVKEPFEDNNNVKLNKVVRIASKDDYLKNKKNNRDSAGALKKCREIVNDLELNMTVVDCRYTFDRNQLLFRFLSDSRIDFRDLARELASIYKTRIELRQIGARDKAREVGGCGQCGRSLCCAGFLKDLDTVSINMAKNQGIALNPTKINGVCGRLMCCLKYENDNYVECSKCLPKVGSTVDTDSGKGKVISVDILNKTYKVDVDGNIVEVSRGSN